MTEQREPMNTLGLAVLHLAVNTAQCPLSVLEEQGLTCRRVGRWLTVLALMRHHGLDADEMAEMLQVSTKTIHRMLHGLRRLQRSDPRVAAAVRRLGEEKTCGPRAA